MTDDSTPRHLRPVPSELPEVDPLDSLKWLAARIGQVAELDLDDRTMHELRDYALAVLGFHVPDTADALVYSDGTPVLQHTTIDGDVIQSHLRPAPGWAWGNE